jgi:SAM-dependent methyltransferase
MGFSRIVGLDLSSDLLRAATDGLQASDRRETAGGVSLVRGDMRAIPYHAYFATVLSLFTSFGYFHKDEENQAALTAVHRALRAGGRFLIDYLNRDHVIANLVACDEQELGDRRVRNVRCLTRGCRRVEKTTTVTTLSGATRKFHESVRLYAQAEMEEMLRLAGFSRVLSYGSLQGEAFDSTSKRLIMVAIKAEGRPSALYG